MSAFNPDGLYIGYYEPLDVTCARCGKMLSSNDAVALEGDEWECFPCDELENAQETQQTNLIDRKLPMTTPESVLYTIRQYPCGCRAEGTGDVPAYCGTHSKQVVKQDIPIISELRHALLRIEDLTHFMPETANNNPDYEEIIKSVNEIARLAFLKTHNL